MYVCAEMLTCHHSVFIRQLLGPAVPKTCRHAYHTSKCSLSSRCAVEHLKQHDLTLLSHILKTPYCEALMGVLRLAARLRPSTLLVSAGSMTPSSHNLALANFGSPSLSYLLCSTVKFSLHRQKACLDPGLVTKPPYAAGTRPSIA